ncbi:MAG: GNAT family N-acetyltransferase [Burkholderiales bacterium]
MLIGYLEKLAMSSETKLPVLHNVAAKRFEVNLDGKLAFSKYLLVGEKMIIEHTEVPTELEGKGIAGTIVRTALDYAREQHLRVMPLCPFTASFIHRHPQYQDLVLEGYRY